MAFSNALEGEFVFDDAYAIVNNADMQAVRDFKDTVFTILRVILRFFDKCMV